ncbi:piggyBac transposable element-derived protein 3-like, partial [Haliotis asinina]|uniref:piggyBac transposable element-derived protein 3-like n=1 Tax=Haliotis asinina TaxID=109174 RepID=UPI00353245E3
DEFSDKKRTLSLRNAISTITADDSDIEDFCESSGDEYLPERNCESDQSFSSDSDDVPLAEVIKQVNDDEDDMPLSMLQDEIPLAKLRRLSNVDITEDKDLQAVLSTLPTGNQNWEKQPFQPAESQFTGITEEPPADGTIGSPYTYFRRMVTEEMLSIIENQTNVYSMQKDGVEVNTTRKEIEIFIGIYLRMGLVKMPRVRSYWESATRFGPIADHMSRNRFEKLALYLHFKDNLTTTNEEKADKLWKLRPWLDSLRSRFLTIPAEEHQSVDEIMVSFKGKSTLKQYMRGKPNPWGFKIWGRAGSSGILYDFDVYQGKK